MKCAPVVRIIDNCLIEVMFDGSGQEMYFIPFNEVVSCRVLGRMLLIYTSSEDGMFSIDCGESKEAIRKYKNMRTCIASNLRTKGMSGHIVE